MGKLLLLFCCFFSPFFAVEQPIQNSEYIFEEEDKPEYQPTDVTALFYKTVLLVVFLSTSIIAGGWLIKRVSGGKLHTLRTGSIELIERQHLSPKTALWLVKVEEQSIVVIESVHGVAIQNLSSLTTEKKA